jgi:hypothetical protein
LVSVIHQNVQTRRDQFFFQPFRRFHQPRLRHVQGRINTSKGANAFRPDNAVGIVRLLDRRRHHAAHADAVTPHDEGGLRPLFVKNPAFIEVEYLVPNLNAWPTSIPLKKLNGDLHFGQGSFSITIRMSPTCSGTKSRPGLTFSQMKSVLFAPEIPFTIPMTLVSATIVAFRFMGPANPGLAPRHLAIDVVARLKERLGPQEPLEFMFVDVPVPRKSATTGFPIRHIENGLDEFFSARPTFSPRLHRPHPGGRHLFRWQKRLGLIFRGRHSARSTLAA